MDGRLPIFSMAAGIMCSNTPPSNVPAASATSGSSNFLSVASLKKSVRLPTSSIASSVTR